MRLQLPGSRATGRGVLHLLMTSILGPSVGMIWTFLHSECRRQRLIKARGVAKRSSGLRIQYLNSKTPQYSRSSAGASTPGFTRVAPPVLPINRSHAMKLMDAALAQYLLAWRPKTELSL